MAKIENGDSENAYNLKNVFDNGYSKTVNSELTEIVYKPTTVPEKSEKWNDDLLKAENVAKPSDPLFLYLAVLTANLLTFAAGTGFSWSSPVIPKLQGPDSPLGAPITSSQESWIASLICLGGGVGPLAAGRMADSIGRKKTLILLTFPILVGYWVVAFAGNVYLYYAARFLLGIGVGSVCAICPMYVGEITEDHNRGKFGCCLSMFLTLGITYVFAVGPFLSIKLLSISCTIPVLLFLIFFTAFMPETPHYLLSKSKTNEAEKALMLLRNKNQDAVQKELYEIRQEIEKESENRASFLTLFKTPGLRRGLFITCGLVTLQQCAGINPVLAYLEPLLKATGSNISAYASSLLVGSIQTVAVVLTSSVIERLGRKILLLASVFGSCVSIVLLGLYFFLKDHKFDVSSISFLPLVSLLVFVVTFNMGIGPIPWALMSEIFPSNAKSSASSLTSSTCFFLSWVVTLVFPFLAEYLTVAGSFWLFGAFCVGGIVFIYLVVPETKGKTFSEIQQMMNGKK